MTHPPLAPEVQALVGELLPIAARRTSLLPGAELLRDPGPGRPYSLTVAEAVQEYVRIEAVLVPGLADRRRSEREPDRLEALAEEAAILEIRRRRLGGMLGLLNPGDWSPRSGSRRKRSSSRAPMTERRPRRKGDDR